MARIDRTPPACAKREHPDAASSVRPPAARFFYGRFQVPEILTRWHLKSLGSLRLRIGRK